MALQHHVAAVGPERLADVVRALGGCEQHGGGRDLVDPAEAADGQLGELGASATPRSRSSSSGVSMGPGAIALTSTPRDDTSRASALVRPMTPALLAE